MKLCALGCEFQHEGFCAVAELTKGKCKPSECKAKKDSDLVCSECGKSECACDV